MATTMMIMTYDDEYMTIMMMPVIICIENLH